MTPALAEVERFRSTVARNYGLSFDDSKLSFLAEILARRGGEASRASYLEALERRGLSSAELRELAPELTVGETYFFRHPEQFQAFSEVAAPARLAACAGARPVRVLSAGCSTGEEPYSLAMLVRERGLGGAGSFAVQGIDLNPVSLARATQGRYSAWALRETSAEQQARWFRGDGREFVLDRGICQAVTFEEQNLNAAEPDPWPAGGFDIIFCRNVVMYFAPDAARRLVARFARALAPGGYLFLGHAETLRGLSTDFHLKHTHDTFYYQRREGPPRPLELLPEPVAPQRPASSAAPAPAGWVGDWVQAVERTSARIRALSDDDDASSPEPRPSSSSASSERRGVDLSSALELLRADRYAQALEVVQQLPVDQASDAEALLLRAMLHTHLGALDQASLVCERLLASDELSAGAHYVLGLCCEGRGELPRAVEHHQVAAYLDATFAMPRVHLGLMARRAGDNDTARNELEQAMRLLQTDEAWRVTLFGGGFTRESLTALCRAELARLGGAP